MRKAVVSREDQTLTLLRYVVAIDLWRGGLSQVQIRSRLGLSTTTVNQMLKGVSREIQIASPGKR